MLICEYCGEVVDEDIIGYSNSYLCTIDGIGYSERVRNGCPACNSKLVEAYECDICGEYRTKDDVYKAINWGIKTSSGYKRTCVCVECLNLKATPKMALALGNYEPNKDKVELNGFLADTFKPKEIEEILIKELIRKGTLNAKAREYCLGDMSAFADCVMDENDNC
jgi:hypothetical protein